MTFNPLLDPPRRSVDLPNAPLHKVIIQLRFSEIFQIENKALLAIFQEKIRAQYPLLVQLKGIEFAFKGDGTVPMQAQAETKEVPMWHFYDLPKNWTVVLTPNFLTLETKSYKNRSDFIDRFGYLLKALTETFSPHAPIIATRLGVRYIDRVIGEPFKVLHELIRTEALGFYAQPFSDYLGYSMSEALLSAPKENALLRVRWSVLPPGTTFEPSGVDAINEISWVLDQDMYREAQVPIDSIDAILNDIREFSSRMYAMFRWVVTPKFLEHYGGKI